MTDIRQAALPYIVILRGGPHDGKMAKIANQLTAGQAVRFGESVYVVQDGPCLRAGPHPHTAVSLLYREPTSIAWTDKTFNPWIGCTHVHAGCTHCYAEEYANRFGKAKWGKAGTRVKTSEANWRLPAKWNREAAESGQRARVFCASLADVFEQWDGPVHSHTGHELKVGVDSRLAFDGRPATLDDIRSDLFRLIDATPWLDWQLLTKRPENILRFWPTVLGENARLNWQATEPCQEMRSHPRVWRRNVWLGTSISDQPTADKAVPELLNVRDLSPVLFLSAEPLLGPINLRSAWRCPRCGGYDSGGLVLHCSGCGREGELPEWVIIGGESGAGARPCNVDWIRSLVAQSVDTAAFVKQLGAVVQDVDGPEWPNPAKLLAPSMKFNDGMVRRFLADKKGGDIEEWPEDLRVREFPRVAVEVAR